MEIKEIIRKNTLDQEEVEFVVEQYIKIRKGVDVKINVQNGMVGSFFAASEFAKLDSAYQSACEWFFKNGY